VQEKSAAEPAAASTATPSANPATGTQTKGTDK
jgi:hypothetical protein